jgi:hypothetical protein
MIDLYRIYVGFISLKLGKSSRVIMQQEERSKSTIKAFKALKTNPLKIGVASELFSLALSGHR